MRRQLTQRRFEIGRARCACFPEKARFGRINAERVGEILNPQVIRGECALGRGGGRRRLSEKWGGQE